MSETFTVNDMKPTAHAVKHQEMAIKRAYDLNDGLIQALQREGTIDAVKQFHRSIIYETKPLRDLFWNDTPAYRDREVWEWIVDHWYSGGLRRSVQDAMHNITDTNKKAIKRKIDELYF
jgi:hypothetical protein